MIVAVDGRRLQDRPLIGAGRWAANLVPLLAQRTELVVLTDARRPPAPVATRQVPLRVPPRLPETAWLECSAARWWRSHPAVFHGTFNAVPRAGRGPSVVTIHDLSFESHPEDLPPAKRRLFAAQARSAARRAAAVVTVSEHARRAIVATYGLDPADVLVAPNAIDPVFVTAEPDPGWLRGRGMTAERYVVALGGARRRGLEVAIGAWRRLRHRGHDVALVVAGPDTIPAEPGLVGLGRVADERWASVLCGAAALCYPTRFEGFGLPALEAAACGVPVVCGRAGPLPEVLGDAAEWCDERDATSVADALDRVLSDGGRHQQLVVAGRARARAAPTWADAAEVVLDAYSRAGA